MELVRWFLKTLFLLCLFGLTVVAFTFNIRSNSRTLICDPMPFLAHLGPHFWRLVFFNAVCTMCLD